MLSCFQLFKGIDRPQR